MEAFQASHRILQDMQVRRYSLELNVDDALLPKGKQSRRNFTFALSGKLLKSGRAQPADILAQLIDILIEIWKLVQFCP